MDVENMKPKKQISLKDTFNKFMQQIPQVTEENIIIIQIVAAVVIGLITLILLIRWLRAGSKSRAVLLMGLCESGKTQLFSQLCYGQDVLSVTSVKESSAQYYVGKKSLAIYDLPGHERIRQVLFDKVKSMAKGIVFTIDSSTIQKDVRDVAEFLYSILSDSSIQKSVTHVLVVCNKQDLPLAKASELVKKTLEKEMSVLRVTRANQLKTVGEGSNNITFLGQHGRDFEFSHLLPLKVDFVETTAKEGAQLDNLKRWIMQLA